MLWAMPVAAPQPVRYTVTCGAAAHRDTQPLQATRYGDGRQVGFDLTDAPEIRDSTCAGGTPFHDPPDPFLSAQKPYER